MSYLPAAYAGAVSTLKTDPDLGIRLESPWLDIVQPPTCVPPPGSEALPVNPCIVETISNAVMIMVGRTLEGLGAILKVAGIHSSARVPYEGDRVAVEKLAWKVLPAFGSGGAGMRALGTF